MNSRHKHFISRVELHLLESRTLEELTQAEFLSLLRSYNAVGASEEAFTTALVATRKFPDDAHLLRWHRDAALGWLAGPGSIAAEFLRCIDENVGPISFWRLALADHYVGTAWADDEQMLGSLPPCPEWLSLAAEQLESAQATAFDFEQYWGPGADNIQATYEAVFDGLLRYEEFTQLRRLR
ncbi:hypothetical protein [Variovorax sp. GB1P17]|uniref:hypothetical protein n=1 Tax=Variovorax sp. GB1P17 TaxID=3443740 RepID=UPI003F46EA7B